MRHALTVGPIKARLRSPPAPEFDVWGVEGQTPARPLRMKLGQTALVTLNNRTDQPLALHWQGVRGHGAIDAPGGFAAEPVAPGASFEYRLTPLDAGVSFFRPLVAGRSGELQDRGVVGALIVEEAKPPQADADIVLVIDDWLLTDDNKVSPFEPGMSRAAAGRLGSWITVNGRPPPERFPSRWARACASGSSTPATRGSCACASRACAPT